MSISKQVSITDERFTRKIEITNLEFQQDEISDMFHLDGIRMMSYKKRYHSSH